MTKNELVQALKNLGGKAFKNDLRLEYIKLHFPPHIYDKDDGFKISDTYMMHLCDYQIKRLVMDGTVERKTVKALDESSGRKFKRVMIFLKMEMKIEVDGGNKNNGGN